MSGNRESQSYKTTIVAMCSHLRAFVPRGEDRDTGASIICAFYFPVFYERYMGAGASRNTKISITFITMREARRYLSAP